MIHRITKQKDSILEALESTNSHPTADWIYSKGRREIPNISLGTIYRNLRELEERGEILELRIDGSKGRFDNNTESHCHFHCVKCQQIFDLSVPACSEIIEKLTQQRGLQITSYMVIFSGLCVECQKNGQ
ncbi:Fur family transcriptional regulator [Chloroflexota bacterium]